LYNGRQGAQPREQATTAGSWGTNEKDAAGVRVSSTVVCPEGRSGREASGRSIR